MWAHVSVERVRDDVGLIVAREIDMGNLTQSVNAGVRPSGTVYDRLHLAIALRRRLEDFLDGQAILLTLPADKRGAVVLDG